MQMGVSRSFAIVHHEEFHLPHWQIFNMILAGSRFLDVALASGSCFGISRREDPGTTDRQAAPLTRDPG